MKDFINKLELAFDKQLADKTNYGRNQVKELFLRACIEVLAEKPEHIQKVGKINRVSEFPSKEEGEEFTTKPRLLPGPVDFKDGGEHVRVRFYRMVNPKKWCLNFMRDDKPTIIGETSIDYPNLEELIVLYHFYKEQIPF